MTRKAFLFLSPLCIFNVYFYYYFVRFCSQNHTKMYNNNVVPNCHTTLIVLISLLTSAKKSDANKRRSTARILIKSSLVYCYDACRLGMVGPPSKHIWQALNGFSTFPQCLWSKNYPKNLCYATENIVKESAAQLLYIYVPYTLILT